MPIQTWPLFETCPQFETHPLYLIHLKSSPADPQLLNEAWPPFKPNLYTD